jgi:hypothetical protein
MPVNGRNKGASAEREFVKILQQEVDVSLPAGHGLKFMRNLEQVRGGGFDIVGLSWLALEIKRQENLSLNSWWEQCERQAEGRVPVLAYRQNNRPWRVRMPIHIYTNRTLVDMSLEDFLDVFRSMLADPEYGVMT